MADRNEQPPSIDNDCGRESTKRSLHEEGGEKGVKATGQASEFREEEGSSVVEKLCEASNRGVKGKSESGEEGGKGEESEQGQEKDSDESIVVSTLPGDVDITSEERRKLEELTGHALYLGTEEEIVHDIFNRTEEDLTEDPLPSVVQSSESSQLSRLLWANKNLNVNGWIAQSKKWRSQKCACTVSPVHKNTPIMHGKVQSHVNYIPPSCGDDCHVMCTYNLPWQ